jgi:putative ABC transport system permease protein
MVRDLIHAWRGLRRSPSFTLAAAATLALGIGANTAMFSVVDTVLLRPLPGYRTEQLVRITARDAGPGYGFVPPEVYLHLLRTAHSFAPLAANQNCRMNFTGRGESEQLLGPCATANWFELFRAQAMLGRTFLPDEDRHGRNHVLVLDYGYWQRRFGGDPKILGQKLTLDGEPWMVAGVMPPGFEAPGLGVWPVYTPYVVADNPHGLNVVGRLKPGVSLESAQSELDAAAAHLAGQNPDWKALKLRATPLLEDITGPQRPLLLLLLGAVSFVLLIACVNVANLLLARSAARRKEIAIRLALGATRFHIARLVLAESLMLAGAASIAAVAAAYLGLRILQPLTGSLPRASELHIDLPVLGYLLLLGTVSAVLSGALPALRREELRPHFASRAQGLLVAGEVALAFVLLAGASLMIRSFVAIRSHDLGYDPRRVLTNFVALPPSPDGSRSAGVGLYARIRERVAALPGVSSVATASALPMFGVSISMPVHPEGESERPRDHIASLAAVSDDYFRVMRIPVRTGHVFTPGDRENSAPVAVVSESIAKRYFGGRTTGRRIVLPEFEFNIDGGKERAVEIVGVVGNVCVNSIEDCDAENIYLPESQAGLRMENLVVRTAGDPEAAARAVRHAVYLEAPNLPLDDPQTLEQRTAYLTNGPKRAMWLLGVFAGLALLLAAVGVYGVSAYLAAGRRREIGIRMALGAGFGDIARLVYRSTLAPAAAGLLAGGVAAAFLLRLLRSFAVGVSIGDPAMLAAAGGALLIIALLAATGPAVRAASANPANVLKQD